jgi:hypothetical protein
VEDASHALHASASARERGIRKIVMMQCVMKPLRCAAKEAKEVRFIAGGRYLPHLLYALQALMKMMLRMYSVYMS